LAKYCRKSIKPKKISQEKLAKLTGLDRTFICLNENGRRNPTFSIISKICSALEVDPSELFSVYEKKDPEYAVKKGGMNARK